MEPQTPYQNHHHLLTVVTGSQRDKTCWPYRVKLMSNINNEIILNKNYPDYSICSVVSFYIHTMLSAVSVSCIHFSWTFLYTESVPVGFGCFYSLHLQLP